MKDFCSCVQAGVRTRITFLCFLFLSLTLSACATREAESASQRPAPPVVTKKDLPNATQSGIDPQWQDLRRRLARDGLAGERVDILLASLGERTQSPMGRKMTELYRYKFLPRPPKKPLAKGAVYKGVVTAKNAQLCRDYLNRNREAFARAEKKYGVPSSVAVSLLFVETRLGRYLGDVKENALETLASMSQSRTLASISNWYGKMPGYAQHKDWFAATMPKRADWAYRETRALVAYMLENNITPDMLPGSFYGAIGLCQFMPSNIKPYGADGNGDGVINLYEPADAVASLSNYLVRHGWKKSTTRQAQHKVLMRYNKSVLYANTILALADLVRQKPAAAGQAKAARR